MEGHVSTDNAQTSKKKKAPGKEWEFANNVCGRYVEWQCKLCMVTKSGGAPRIREHFLGGPKKGCRTCTHPQAPTVAKRLREVLEKKSNKRHYVETFAANASQEHASNHVTPTSTTEQQAQGDILPGSVSSKQRREGRSAQMRQRSLHQSF